MIRIKLSLIIILCFGVKKMLAQNIELLGTVYSNGNVENIHVFNKTSNQYTITNQRGEFKVVAKLNDTLQFSSIQHTLKEIIITPKILNLKSIVITLEEQVNELDEVLVGNVLTGDLLSDVKNVKGKPPINFFDVGIPGYKGKIATQSERRLAEAGEFKPIMLVGLIGGGLPLNPIINGISGRTKMLKNRVKLEQKEALMQSIKARLGTLFFDAFPLDDSLKNDFFYFCSDDPLFTQSCANKPDFEILNFLKEKYEAYLNNQAVNAK